MVKVQWHSLRNNSHLPLAFAYALGLGIRLYLATQAPSNSTDLLRHVGFGKEFWHHSLSIYNYAPRDFGDAPYAALWPNQHYIYPAISMFFFAFLAALWPSLFFPRLVLTLIELANGLLMARLSHNRWFGLAYFLNPVSMWWYSHEGQYEPVVALLTLLSLLYLARRSVWGYAWLGLGIQAK
ncbi:MAG: hypothetical protein GX605_10030, partial [Chloroflexi bacterium]|nr:hypothetical protein [Chloroflexota bacterium]